MKKKITIKSAFYILAFSTSIIFTVTSCQKDLLNQMPTTAVPASSYWNTENDALYALYGAYNAIRPVFDRDYYFDGLGEYVRTRNDNNSTVDGDLNHGDAYRDNWTDPSNYSNFDKMYRALYGGVNRANYVIENVNKMLDKMKSTASPATITNLEAIVGEARLLRGMVYFKLISMWGDVPLIDHVIFDNSEVANISRTPIKDVKNFIMDDFAYAFDKLPAKGSALGRAGKPAALAFRGKLQLYWACWNHFGWPELDTFSPSEAEAQDAYKGAADDFKKVVNDYGLTLYQNGEPGLCDPPGKADNLPNYYYLFTPLANGDPENIMAFTHGGTGTGQGEELMRDFAGRSHEGSQCWIHPRYEIADRYQSIITGDFCDKLIPIVPTEESRVLKNSAVNPESYADRDYRMKATIQWDFERSIGMVSLKSTGWCPFVYKTWGATITASNYQSFTWFTTDDIGLITYNTDGCNSGYVFRKFVRNYAGQGRSDGDFAWPVMRLADVYLMYAEATNELNGPQADAIDLVNRVRHRGNLPPLAASKTADKASFFAAIEQERIVELIGEGQRSFDIRRWRAIERVWCPPKDGNGIWRIDTNGANQSRYFQNLDALRYQRCYIFRIPPSERDRNPNLTQNKPWL